MERPAEAGWQHLITKRQMDAIYNEQQSERSHQNSLTHRDLWNWLIEHGAPRNERDSLLNSYLYKQKKSSR